MSISALGIVWPSGVKVQRNLIFSMSQSWSCSGRLPHTENLTGAWCLKSECNKNDYENITSKETGWMGCFKHNCFVYMSCAGCRGGVHIIRGLLGKQRTTSPRYVMASGSASPLLPSSHQTGCSHCFLSLAVPVDPASHHLLNSPWAMSYLLTHLLFDQDLISFFFRS